GNVRSTLRLTESTEELRRHLHASVRPQAEVIAISATDKSADHARQIAQEAAVVFGQLVDARFGSGTPELHAATLDSAHVLAGPDRHYLRNTVIGALVGLLVGSAAMFLLAGEAKQSVAVAPAADDRDLKKRERLLEDRLKGVTERERALAGRAGKLAAREKELEERLAKISAEQRKLSTGTGEVDATKRELADRAARVAARERELEEQAAAPTPPPPPTPEPEPTPQPVRTTRPGAWNVDDLQSRVDAQSNVSPERAEEWRTYLFFLREHASSDGALPPQFDGLVQDVFGELI
ncbi:MAG: hypothetical protein QOF27_1706, partial [Gaiellaceae bacterium]|nr:hypothetical protein [Gaiellaceae bacterium]